MSVTDAVRAELELLTVDDVCGLFKVDRSWVYRHWRELGGRKVGKYLRFRPEAVAAWLDT